MHKFLTITTVLYSFWLHAQLGIDMHVQLNDREKTLTINQSVNWQNTTEDSLQVLYFYDWNHAFSTRHTALSNRFIQAHKRNFYLSRKEERGYTRILSIESNGSPCHWERDTDSGDIIKVLPPEPIPPGHTTQLKLRLVVKLPHSKFTGYGYDKDGYSLRYWFPVPARHATTGLPLSHHLNTGLTPPSPMAEYSIQLNIPPSLQCESNLPISSTEHGLLLQGNSTGGVRLILRKNHNLSSYTNDSLSVVSDIPGDGLNAALKSQFLSRQIRFLQKKIGRYPLHKILLIKADLNQNPVYGLNLLPSFLNPFPESFRWDIGNFKALTHRYIEGITQGINENEYALISGIEAYLMQQYIKTYYPEVKLTGKLSKIPFIRSYHLANTNFNERLYLGYAYTARYNLDQSPSTPVPELSNYNRRISVPFKTALGLEYLSLFISKNSLESKIKEYLHSDPIMRDMMDFKKLLSSFPREYTGWFFEDWLSGTHKFDYCLSSIKKRYDSLIIHSKNCGGMAAPVILSSQVHRNTRTVTTSMGFLRRHDWHLSSDSLTYDHFQLSPLLDIHRYNNHKPVGGNLSKPLKIRWLSDINDPESNQIFFNPGFAYNYYDGLIAAVTFSNKAFLKKDFTYKITPAYGFKSHSLTGWFNLKYWKHLDHPHISSIKTGVGGALFHYKNDLIYRKLTPYFRMYFKRNYRSVKYRALHLSYTWVDRDIDMEQKENDRYAVWTAGYSYYNPHLIRHREYSIYIEREPRFTKLYGELRYRKLMRNKRHWDVRFFGGIFARNQSTSDYFSFGVNRPYDYLFKHKYYGRSETSGIFSRQIVIADGGFIAPMPVKYSDKWLMSSNLSISLWKFLEIYSNHGWVKTRSAPGQYLHDSGIRLNFIDRILEVYLPVYSINGWEINRSGYAERIRFVLDVDFMTLYNYLRRGVY